MAWGIVMSLFTVAGMLMLVMAHPREVISQTFGQSDTGIRFFPAEPIEMKKAAQAAL